MEVSRMHRRKTSPPPEGHRPRRTARRGRRGLLLYVFALIGAAAVLFLLIRFLIIPLLVLAA